MTEENKPVHSPVIGFSSLPISRQIILLAGLAFSIASGVAVFMWFQKPSFKVLYSTLAEKDAGQVIDALTKAGIDYRLDPSSGAVMVSGDQVHQARLKLAMDGLPEGGNMGFEMLDKKRSIGASPFMETARYQRAIEGELARSITTLKNVKGARVHLAIPERSVFVRDRKPPSASVLLDVYAGRMVSEGQVAAIIHLVAASVPNLTPEGVTVVDQSGSLLSSNKNSKQLMRAAYEFDFVRKVEQDYVKRIENILEPIVGNDGMRAQVSADLDLSTTEQTQELYDPELRALRSEQTIEERGSGTGAAAGIPGAVSNQPPPAGQVRQSPRQANAKANGRSSRRSNRNFDLSRTINYTRMPAGTVRRLSVAVVINDKQSVDAEGKPVSVAHTPEEMARLTALVKEAVGFDERRGDSLNVANASFTRPPAMEPLPSPPVWEAPWLRDILKILFGMVVASVFYLAVMRPVMRNLAAKSVVRPLPQMDLALEMDGGQEGMLTSKPVIAPPTPFDERLSTAKNIVGEDPKKVAKVVKSWLNEDE